MPKDQLEKDRKKNKLTTANSESESTEEYSRGNHPNSRANLQPFEKGVSGNPLGRPYKFENLKNILNEYGDEETFNWNNESEGTRREQVWERIWWEAKYGDMKFIQLLAQLGCLDD